MKLESPLCYDPGLVEEAVFLAVEGRPEAKRFHRERDRIYGIKHPEERELAFSDLHRAWFLRLGLADPIEKAVSEQPLLLSDVKSCLVARAPGKNQEGAELFVNPEGKLSDKQRRTVGIFLRPESLLDLSALLTFLRHELMHITDMLGPGFGYEPELPPAEGGPTHDRLVKERYRVLWDTTIEGRMVRRGWLPESIRDERLKEFCRAFPMLGEKAAQAFGGFFDRESHTHAQLAAFVLDPRVVIGEMPSPGGRCPLCGFLTYAFEHKPEHLSSKVLDQISQEFPRWRPFHGLCKQCADLYRTRRLSAAAARHLPGTDEKDATLSHPRSQTKPGLTP